MMRIILSLAFFGIAMGNVEAGQRLQLKIIAKNPSENNIADTPPTPLIADLPEHPSFKHIVVLMMENRSFDNVLAWLYSEENPPNYFIPSNTDPHYLGLSETALSQYTNTLKNSKGQVVYTCPPIKGIPSVASTPYINSPCNDPHETFDHATDQIYQGGELPVMSGFLQDYASYWAEDVWLYEKPQICSVMETYTEKELPVVYTLAKQYAVSDLWFSSVPTQTNPNRAFTHCGTSDGQIDNGFDNISVFDSDTIWNRLHEESPETTWMIFWQGNVLGFADGPFTGPKTFSSLRRIPDLNNHYQRIDGFHELARNGKLPHFTFIEPQWTLGGNLALKDFLIKIVKDQNWIIGPQGNDLHPPTDVRTGENLLANVYTSLIANEETWKDTLLVVVFDEHGGLFDHIPPPNAIPPDQHFQEGFQFNRYGVRVPAIFISPRIRPGTIIRSDTDIPFDHTSLIATILKWRHVNPSQWNMGNRTQAAPTFENVITLTEPRQDASLPASNVVQMGDKFYLRDKNGNYLSHSELFFRWDARYGSDKVPISFMGGSGAITHGSFVMIQSHDPSLEGSNLLGTSLFHYDCIYAANEHTSGQWWTIKSVDHSTLGAKIQYGDRVYLENHIYDDLLQYVPARLGIDESFFGEFLKTQSVAQKDSNHWWVIERIEE